MAGSLVAAIEAVAEYADELYRYDLQAARLLVRGEVSGDEQPAVPANIDDWRSGLVGALPASEQAIPSNFAVALADMLYRSFRAWPGNRSAGHGLVAFTYILARRFQKVLGEKASLFESSPYTFPALTIQRPGFVGAVIPLGGLAFARRSPRACDWNGCASATLPFTRQ